MKNSTKPGLMASAYFAVAVHSGYMFFEKDDITRRVFPLTPSQNELVDLEDKLIDIQRERFEAIPFRKTEEDRIYLTQLRKDEFALEGKKSEMLDKEPELEDFLLKYKLSELGIAMGYAMLCLVSLLKGFHHSVDAGHSYLDEKSKSKPL